MPQRRGPSLPWTTTAVSLACLAGLSVLAPSSAPWTLAAGAALFTWNASLDAGMPSRIRRRLGRAFSRSAAPGAAAALLAVDAETGEEVWIERNGPGNPLLLVGPSCSGKTEAMLSLAASAIATGSGAILVDGKGDVAVFAKVCAMARALGREDDVLLLNFMTGEQPYGTILSNTMNPFATGSADSLTHMAISLMDDVGGDGAMWRGRAVAMLTGVMRALCCLRDEGVIDLNVAAIRDHLSLRRVIDLANEEKHPQLSPAARHTIKSYLASLPGFQPEKGYKQAQTTLDQHGYLEMQFTKIFGSLADIYGHIFATSLGEVDMRDVVLNRRILVVMLPALEKSSDEVADLGKIVVASLMRMMGFTIGNRLEGASADIVRRLGDGVPPMACFFDDVAYYCVDGMDLMASQAAPLGITVTFGTQDVEELQRIGGMTADTIVRASKCVLLGAEGVGRGRDKDHPERPLAIPYAEWPRPDHLRANHMVKIRHAAEQDGAEPLAPGAPSNL